MEIYSNKENWIYEIPKENTGPYIALVGIGMGTTKLLTGEAKSVIEHADAIIGANRMLKVFDEQGKVCFAEYRSEEIVKIIKEHQEYKKWAVVLSGDTGFYSGANKLFTALVEQGLEAYCVPGIASVVYLSSMLGVSWEDAALRSLHGRSQNIVYAIDHNKKTFVLLGTDGGTTLCSLLKKYQFEDVMCYVGNQLSYPSQRILAKKGCDLKPEDVDDLATVLIVNPDAKEKASVHIRDEEFLRVIGAGGVPMTKEEVRAVSIAKLGLSKHAVVYDVGAGTGSISIEAALHSEDIRVYAIEQREEACDLIERNKIKFRADQIQVIHGKAPEVLEALEAPTHVFIGGSAGNLKEIIRLVKEKNEDVRIVLNAISMETIGEVMECIKEGLLVNPEMVQMNISKSKTLGSYHMMTGQNPIYIITEQ